MQSKIPLYPYNAKTAQERGEIEKWRESFRENCACAGGIDILIRENFDGMHLKAGTVEKIVELYGYKRVEHVLANTVQERRGDGRFRPDNRAWAESHYIPEDEMHNYCFAARSHSAILDGFISHYRKLVMDLGMFDQKQCEPNPEKLDYTGKVLVLSPNTLKEEYWSPENQLWLAESGFGCSPLVDTYFSVSSIQSVLPCAARTPCIVFMTNTSVSSSGSVMSAQSSQMSYSSVKSPGCPIQAFASASVLQAGSRSSA